MTGSGTRRASPIYAVGDGRLTPEMGEATQTEMVMLVLTMRNSRRDQPSSSTTLLNNAEDRILPLLICRGIFKGVSMEILHGPAHRGFRPFALLPATQPVIVAPPFAMRMIAKPIAFPLIDVSTTILLTIRIVTTMELLAASNRQMQAMERVIAQQGRAQRLKAPATPAAKLSVLVVGSLCASRTDRRQEHGDKSNDHADNADIGPEVGPAD
ncbi:hypothetical protein DL766_006772 [Monosporascus sp. MC13-8B]|uniref:Uncharacterized protein n=1 Tax=Monosporascus cannonballus TaxID=155416 RepID=A0ABY0HF29_9PEZI|nr:hypothetical protein DL763_008763 [Monosporascus cannonballus]RYO91696.1 hypothetical protein DL762_002025 [Monosporascus cannonballus]RYP26279.1 hypothetical protein DL766_006772 [Monosporascus sp. MC13-8B]